jgi:Uma2 family endonuclease
VAGAGRGVAAPTYFRDPAPRSWSPSAVVVVEVVSPEDESRAKLPFYHRIGVEEAILADPERRTIDVLVRGPRQSVPAEASVTLGIAAEQLRAAMDWPD